MSERTAYVLGSDDAEVARLDRQAASIAGPTDALLRAAGVGGPMRVLDLGTGLGHVAFQLAGMLDPEGSVLGVDQAERLLAVAEQRRAAAGAENIEFAQADVRTFAAGEQFDAIVARLLFFHLPDREAVLRRQLEALRPGGTMILVEFDIGAMRSEPPVPLVESAQRWMEAAFSSAGADPRIGARAGELLRRAGLRTSRRSGSRPTSAPAIRPGRPSARGHEVARTADRGAGHRERGGARTGNAAGADRGAGHRPRRGDDAARRRRRLGNAAGRGCVSEAVRAPVPAVWWRPPWDRGGGCPDNPADDACCG